MIFSRWLVDKFITFAVTSGKTTSIRNQALTEFNNGKKCAIVTEWDKRYNLEEHFKLAPTNPRGYKPTGEYIDVWRVENVINIIKGGGHQEDPSSTWWKVYPEFKEYDFLYVDADCYEYIIRELINQLNTIRQKSFEITKLMSNINSKLEEINENCSYY